MTDLTDADLREPAENVVEAAQFSQAANWLRAAVLAKQWVGTKKIATAHKHDVVESFIAGYLAAIKDRT